MRMENNSLWVTEGQNRFNETAYLPIIIPRQIILNIPHLREFIQNHHVPPRAAACENRTLTTTFRWEFHSLSLTKKCLVSAGKFLLPVVKLLIR